MSSVLFTPFHTRTTLFNVSQLAEYLLKCISSYQYAPATYIKGNTRPQFQFKIIEIKCILVTLEKTQKSNKHIKK